MASEQTVGDHVADAERVMRRFGDMLSGDVATALRRFAVAADWVEAAGLALVPWQRQLLDEMQHEVRSAAELRWAGVRAARAEQARRQRLVDAFNAYMAQVAQARRTRVHRMHTMYGRRHGRG